MGVRIEVLGVSISIGGKKYWGLVLGGEGEGEKEGGMG
jgi:hypothetical protein